MATRKPYVKKQDILRELRLSKERFRTSNIKRTEAECVSPLFAEYFMMMVKRFSTKNQWRGYTYVDDMQCEALVTLCQNALKFDEEKSDNPFAYYTQIIKNCFISFIEKEHKLRDIRDAISIEMNMRPSYHAQLKSEEANKARE